MGGSVRVLFLSVLVFLSAEIIQSTSYDGEVKEVCIERERQALLDFKQGLIDPMNRLSSWVGDDCCRWSGVGCNNRTGHVVKLNLPNLLPSDQINSGLSAKINPSLLQLNHLDYLDLSSNDFGYKPIPKFIGSFKKLTHLDLSDALFGGMIPHDIGNLSSLVYLNLSSTDNSFLKVDNFHWLSRLSSLQHLDLGRLNLSQLHDWWQAINMLPSLSKLLLNRCELPNMTTSPYDNFTSLSVLDLSENEFGPRIPDWLFNFSHLEYLNLQGNYFQDPIPQSLGKLSSLKYLYLDSNKLNGPIPESLGNLSSLEDLRLHYNNLSGPIPESLGKLSSLKHLFLKGNKLNGSLPESLGQLSELISLIVSFNLLKGIVSEAHFASLTKFESLHMSSNSLVLEVSSNWMPPFQLKDIQMRSCRVGPQFPAWLREQRDFFLLDLSNANISDSIPYWFWNLSSQVSYLNLSHNQINGEIPNSLLNLSHNQINDEIPNSRSYSDANIDLSFNSFRGSLPHSFLNARIWILDLSNNFLSGPIPKTFGELSPPFLSLSHNYLNGSIPLSFCQMVGLSILDLSSNQLTGELPQCSGNFTWLETMDLANNNIHGRIPESLGFTVSLIWLRLRSNDFSGELPTSLRNLTNLRAIDFSENNFSGKIPTWIGESLSALKILKLSSNKFSGTIPPQLCHLTSLQILDLAQNKLLGAIPRCFSNFSAMATTEHRTERIAGSGYAVGIDDGHGYKGSKQYEENMTVIIKGQKLDYTRTLFLVSVIDLSSNHLSGEIPENLASLSDLHSLNLSGNHLTGNIPKNINGLRSLESLDLSHNQLSGAIPQNLSALNFLSSLDLSHNKLSGQIPSGNQLQTLTDPSIYSDNLDLCGPPLPKCRKDETSQAPMFEEEEEEEGFEQVWFFTSMAPGFVVGFWGVCGVLIFKKSWRISYFRLSDKVMDTIFVVWVTKVAKLKTMLRG